MSLRGTKPATVRKRLKLMVYGEAGSGKTLAAAQFKNNYMIDTERGCENKQYTKALEDSGSVIFQTSAYDAVMAELTALMTESHDYRTVTIDPITTIFHEQLEAAEDEARSGFGNAYGKAGAKMRRLNNRLMALDMNVILTCHSKVKWGQDMARLGITFDSWNKTDFLFDLILHLYVGADPTVRRAKIVKTRIEEFPLGEEFVWSYGEFVRRYGKEIEAKATPAKLASPQMLKKFTNLLNSGVELPAGTLETWKTKAGVDDIKHMTDEQVRKCIKYIEDKIKGK